MVSLPLQWHQFRSHPGKLIGPRKKQLFIYKIYFKYILVTDIMMYHFGADWS